VRYDYFKETFFGTNCKHDPTLFMYKCPCNGNNYFGLPQIEILFKETKYSMTAAAYTFPPKIDYVNTLLI
jgi:hypothetical protein